MPDEFSGLQDGAALEGSLARLGFRLAHLAEEMQVRGHHDSRAKMSRWRQMNLVGEVIGEEAYRDLPLAVRVLINRRGDDSFLKVGRHFRKKIRSDQLYFPLETMLSKRAAYRETVDRIYIKSVEIGETPQQFGRLLKALGFVLVSFDDADDFSPGTMPQKSF